MMRIIILFLIYTSTLFAGGFETVFQQGNEHYKIGNYEKARSFYQLLEQKGVVDDALFYNIGNCYAREKQFGYAILYYEKALSIDPDFQFAMVNLNMIREKNIDQVLNHSGKVETVGIHAIYAFLRRINTTLIMGSFILFWLLLWGILIAKKFRVSHFKRNIYTFLAILFTLILIFNGVLLGGNYYASEKIRLGVAVIQEVTVFEGPGEKYKPSFIIHEGLKVNITNERAKWFQITLPNGNIGWAQKSILKEI